MEINYDKDADALYIEFRKGKFVKNKKIDDFTIIDLDEKGNLLGIEILRASKRIPQESLSEVHVKNLVAIT
ncbi:hypothetical protein AYK26_06230 [Euryarchaeota archaeon SM23-78]|nr:MAG: hypothetical protein AYK26_06230 [Euryarchaeota archaeon SM23-78]MBW3001302.1 DUF2283 domain-containing protein [Candidatus Woesearchaeota archaeon]